MLTTHVIVKYKLTEIAYRAEVAVATGPIDRRRQTEIPVGDLTPEGRLALLVIPSLETSWDTMSTRARPTFDAPTELAMDPTPSEISVWLVAKAAEAKATVAAEAKAEKAKKEKAAVEAEEWLTRLEQDPRLAVIKSRWTPNCIPGSPGDGIHGDGYLCPHHLKPRLAALRARVEAQLAQKATESTARLAQREIDARTWIVSESAATRTDLPPELIRAAGEGRHVISALAILTEERVREAICRTILTESCHGCCVATTYSDGEPRDDVPTPIAYALLDALTAELPALVAAAALPNARVTIGPIARYDVAPRGDAVWRTGITVAVAHPWCSFEVDVLTET